MTLLFLHQGGACVGKDVSLWFPTRSRGPKGSAEAKAVCSGCPVRVECLEYALKEDMSYGIWGGTTPTERKRMKHDTTH